MSNIDPLLHHRLRRLKAALLAVSFTLAGILLMMLNAWLTPMQLGDWQWLHALPLGELGGTLFGAGLLSTFFEYAFRRDQKRAATRRFLLYQPCDEQWWLIARQLGVQLQRARIARGLSQEALAHAASISTYTYQKFEKGESRPGTPMNPRLRTLIALAAALDMRVEELVGGMSE